MPELDLAIGGVSVCLSVCHTLVLTQNMWFSLRGSPETLVFDTNFLTLVSGVPACDGFKRDWQCRINP